MNTYDMIQISGEGYILPNKSGGYDYDEEVVIENVGEAEDIYNVLLPDYKKCTYCSNGLLKISDQENFCKENIEINRDYYHFFLMSISI